MTVKFISLGVLAGAVALGFNGPAATQQIAPIPGAQIATLSLGSTAQPDAGLGSAFGSAGLVWARPGAPAAPDLFLTTPLHVAGGQTWSVGYRAPEAAPQARRFPPPRAGWPAVIGAPSTSRSGAAGGAVAFTYQPGSSWHLGAGVRASALEAAQIPTGPLSRQSYGVQAFAAYEPPGGLRIRAATVGSSLETRSVPGANALEPARNIKSYGKSVQLGWEIEVDQAGSLMPFARVDAFDTTLTPYAEAKGPLPPEYYQIEDHVRVARVGIEGIAYAADNLRLWLRGNWGHRTEGTLADTTGKLFGFYTGFADPGARASRDWGEAGIGLGWQIQPGMSIQASVGGASDGERDASVSGAFGLNWRL